MRVERDYAACERCMGRGQILMEVGDGALELDCPECIGDGYVCLVDEDE